jgi:hypothetical protein
MTTSVEFYSKLREHIPDEAAKMIAEHLVTAEQVATKADVKAEVTAAEARLNERIGQVESGIHRWMLTFFAAQWLGTVGIIVAIFLKH